MPWEWESLPQVERDINMADVTPNFIRGFLVPLAIGPDNIWLTQSNFTQQNPTAGDPNPINSSKMRLLATGNQSDNGNISIVTRRAGSASFGSRFTFKDNTTSTSVEYGKDDYNGVTDFEIRKLSGTIANQYYVPTAITTDRESLLVAYQTTQTSNNEHVSIMRIDKEGTETTQNIYSVTGGALFNTQKFHPCLCQLSDESIILVHLLESSGLVNIRVHRSVDDGVTWDVVAREAIDIGLPIGVTSGAGTDTYNIKRVRIASNGFTIVMLVNADYNNTSTTKRNTLFQYVSINGGGTFTRISTDTNLISNSFAAVDIHTRNGEFVVSYIGDTSNVHYIAMPNPFSNIHLLREASSFVTINTPNAATGTNDYMLDGQKAMNVDSDGGIYIYVYSHGSNDYYLARYSSDGSTFYYMNGNFSVSNGTLINLDDSTTKLVDTFVTNFQGRNIIISTCQATSTIDNSLLFTYLGGYANVNYPRSNNADADLDWSRISFVRSYIPIDEPANIGGLSTVGTGNDTLSGGYLKITSNGIYPQPRYYSWNNLPTTLTAANYNTQGMLIRCSLIVDSGGDFTNNKRGIVITSDDGSDLYAFQCWFSTTQIRLHDDVSGSAIMTVNVDNTQGVDVIISTSNGKVSLWYRLASLGELRTWSNGTSNTSLTAATSAATRHQIQFGHLTYASGTMITNWNEFHVSSLDAVGENMSSGFTNPNDCSTRAYPPIGQYAYIFDGVKISSSDGPTYEGDEFNITPQFDYPIDNIFFTVAPTPRIGWRSLAVASGNIPSQAISIKLDETDFVNNYMDNMGNDLIGFHFNGVNWHDAEIFYHNGTSWVSLAQIDNKIHCSCVVSGRTARGGTTQGKPYFTLNELAGWTCYFPVGEADEFRLITGNTEGKFGHAGGSTNKDCIIYFDEAPPQSATEIYLIPPRITMAISMNGKKASGFKLVTGPQQTYHNDIRIGELLIGPVIIPGRQYSRGRTISIESGSVTATTQDGIRYTRDVQPTKRNFRVAWTDGIDITDLQGLEPTPNYWKASNQTGSQPVAVNNEVPDLMMGFLKYLKGSKNHFVYLPNIAKSTSASGDIRNINRDKEHALVTLDNDITIEHVVGDELQPQSGEVFRVANMSFTEVV